MSYRVGYRPEAFADIAEAFLWYEAQRPGLGDQFEAAIGATVQLVATMPLLAPVVARSLRRALIPRFPFALYYSVEESAIQVRAVLHTSRDQGEWLRGRGDA